MLRQANVWAAVTIAVCAALIPVPCSSDYLPRKGFVSLQFDDSRYTNYTDVYPLLESYGFMASFGYITESSQLGIEHDAWMMQEIYLAGHEVQDHTTRHNFMWATHVDTVDDGVKDWIPYTFADVATWDSLCQRSLFILDSLGIEVIGWNEPGGGVNSSVPDHPGWRWLGAEDDSLFELISTKYPYAVAYGVPPHTAHLNLRGHNCPQRFPFFNVPHVMIDFIGAEDVKTGIADAVASGLWYLAVSHVRDMQEVAKVESLVEWLYASDIEVLKCFDGWQRIAYGQPDPLANQFPQAEMKEDKDGNGKPDGFMGSCAWDTSAASPVASAFCMSVFGETEFYCYGPEVGANALSLWVKSAASGGGAVRIVWAKSDFEWACLGTGFNTFYPDTAWTRVDTTVCPNMVMEVEDEVDRIKVIIRPLDCGTLFVAYPELLLIDPAGIEMVDGVTEDAQRLIVKPNPVRCGETVRITPARNVEFYDVLGRHVLPIQPLHANQTLTIDTSELAPGVYFIRNRASQDGGLRLVVIP